MSDWGASDVKAWKKKARAQQQSMFLRLGDRRWDEWRKSDRTILHRKVGFGLFSLPEDLPDEDNPTGYNEDQFEKIKRVSRVILRNAKSGRFIRFACIFVFGKIWDDRFVIPVFKVKGDENRTLFVDSDCRVYNSWRDYLDTNRLPKCMYCYPRNGVYQEDEGQVLVDFGTSPACDLVNRIWSALDSTVTAVNFASTTVLAASLLTVPIAAPAIAVAQAASATAGLYGVTRGVTTLVDRHFHDQSINPADSSEARNAWLGILGCALGSAQSRIHANITRGAAAGNIGSKILAITFNVITVGSLTVKGMGTLNGFISLVDKADKGTLTFLDVHQFSTSLLFFSNDLIHSSTARRIIENVQREVLNGFAEDLTPRQIEELFRRFDQAPGRTRLQRNGNNIRSIRNIENRRDFFQSLSIDWDEDDRD